MATEASNERVVKCVCEWRQEAVRRPSLLELPCRSGAENTQGSLLLLTPQPEAGGGAEVQHEVSFEVYQPQCFKNWYYLTHVF